MKKLMIAMAAMGLSSVAMAGPSWTYVDLGYAQGSSAEEAGLESVDGYDLTGSFGFAGIWHINGTYGTISVDNGSSDVDIDFYRIGAGVHPAITDSTDFVAEIGYTGWEVDVPNGPEPDAIDLTLGVRSMVTDQFELNGFLATQIASSDGALDGGNNDDATLFSPSLGGQYFFTDNISVNVSYTWNDVQSTLTSLNSDTARFGVRWSF